MEEAETLQTIAEVAIAIAGFTGVVVVFGGRVRGKWTRLESDRLWLLLAQALIATLLSFLPLLLYFGGLANEPLWRLSNGAFATAFAGIGAHIAFKQRGLERYSEASSSAAWFVYSTFAIGTLIAAAQVAYAAGILPARGSFLFLLGLLFLVAMAVSNFWQLLISSVSVSER